MIVEKNNTYNVKEQLNWHKVYLKNIIKSLEKHKKVVSLLKTFLLI